MLRLTLVISTVLVALVVPGVKQMIGLAGAVAGASTALIIPPLLALHFSRVEQGHKDMAWPVVRSYFLIVVGVIIGVFGTAAAVYDVERPSWIKSWVFFLFKCFQCDTISKSTS